MAIHFSSTDELIDHLRLEQKKGERFATRFILVQGCQAWDDLIPKLNYEVDRVVRLSDFCSAPDVFPDMEQLKSDLGHSVGSCNSILLTPLAECIRLDPETADVIGWLAERPAERINRIYVPLLAAEEFFQSAINRVPRYHQGLLPDFWLLQGGGNSEVIVAPFCAEDANKNVIRGIEDYLLQWSQGSIRKAWLVTEMAPWLSVRQTRGECRVRIYPSSFDYVRRNIRWEELREKWGSLEQWEWLAVQIEPEESLDQLAARILKVVQYDMDQLFYFWPGVTKQEQWLIWLWSKASSKPRTYLHAVMQTNDSVDDFGHHVTTDIFHQTLPAPPPIGKERRQLLRCLGTNYMPAEFWEHYDMLKDPLQKISVLTDVSQQEREQTLACVRELLISKINSSKWWDYLELAFPALAWYLQPVATGDEFADSYSRAFNRCRMIDGVDERLTALIDQWANQQLLWRYPPRSELISKLRADGAKIMWIDAMGVEWTGLLSQLLTQDGRVDCSVTIAKCNLPTITDANKEWETGETVVRGLDDIAHHYDYSFPESFLEAMQVIQGVADKALALLAQYPVVVITSDHGLSRFVVTDGEKTKTPEGLVTEAPGRFGSLEQDSYHIEPDHPLVMDKGRVMWLTHNRFRSAGPCRGEAHGGATPEECLIPVIIIRRTEEPQQELPEFKVLTKPVKLNAANEGSLTIRSNKAVSSSVELRAASYHAFGKPGVGFDWSFHLKDWRPGSYKGRLFCANRLIGEIDFEVVKGIMEQDFGL
jgi:hypothetical protein